MYNEANEAHSGAATTLSSFPPMKQADENCICNDCMHVVLSHLCLLALCMCQSCTKIPPAYITAYMLGKHL